MTFFSVFLGGGIGAILRFLIRSVLSTHLATFIVNIIGSFIIGFLYIYFIEKSGLNPILKITLTAGFCGGLTTFSTFSLELFEMIGNHQFLNAVIYIILSITVCITAVMIGAYCAKII